MESIFSSCENRQFTSRSLTRVSILIIVNLLLSQKISSTIGKTYTICGISRTFTSRACQPRCGRRCRHWQIRCILTSAAFPPCTSRKTGRATFNAFCIYLKFNCALSRILIFRRNVANWTTRTDLLFIHVSFKYTYLIWLSNSSLLCSCYVSFCRHIWSLQSLLMHLSLLSIFLKLFIYGTMNSQNSSLNVLFLKIFVSKDEFYCVFIWTQNANTDCREDHLTAMQNFKFPLSFLIKVR